MVHYAAHSNTEEYVQLQDMMPTSTPEPLDEFEAAPLAGDGPSRGYANQDARVRKHMLHIGLSFFLFGLINNVLYVIILSAALDLVPPSTPKGIIAFCNIAPAFVAKVGWPYILKGRIRYAKRLVGCCLLSFTGMVVVSAFNTLGMRLLGISLASFASGLGELTFLQLSTTYHPSSVAGHCVGYFASGTGAAGLAGAFLWWELRKLGVRVGVGLSSVLPFVNPLVYFVLLPPAAAFRNSSLPESYDDEDIGAPITASYMPIPANDAEDLDEEPNSRPRIKKGSVTLSAADKWRLVKPLFWKYMIPLFCVYTFEYTINQGIAPTLVYPIPSPDEYALLSLIIHSIRDYYPLWQLVYQSTVFLSRSSISLGIPPLPQRLLPLPAIVQIGILILLALEAGIGLVPSDSEGLAIALVFVLISLEGICGGSAYVNVFYRINQESPSSHSNLDSDSDPERAMQEKEFKIGSVGFADSTGILLASLIAMPTEIGLCRAQVARGKTLCQQL